MLKTIKSICGACLSVMLLFSCNTTEKIDVESYKLSWTKNPYRGYSPDDPFMAEPNCTFFDKLGYKGFYPVDTIRIKDCVMVRYKYISFIGPANILLPKVKHLNYDILFDKRVFLCGMALMHNRDIACHIPKGFIFKSYFDQFADIEDINNKTRVYKFSRQPKYLILGLMEFGDFLSKTNAFAIEDSGKIPTPDKKLYDKLGVYYRVAFPVF